MLKFRTATGWVTISGSQVTNAMTFGGTLTDWNDLPITSLTHGLLYINTATNVGRVYSTKDSQWHSIGNVQITIDDALSETSTNPIQNKVVTTALNNKQNKFYNQKNEPLGAQPGDIWVTEGNILETTSDGVRDCYIDGKSVVKNGVAIIPAYIKKSFFTVQTTLPTAPITDGGLHIVYISGKMPTTTYNGYTYITREFAY